jgi:hypothetical protein
MVSPTKCYEIFITISYTFILAEGVGIEPTTDKRRTAFPRQVYHQIAPPSVFLRIDVILIHSNGQAMVRNNLGSI